ncbi:MAG: glycosyltransferase [Clostridia bacterium]|nr:glycosyltransferase [Clostridia bacterium]
MVSVIIACYNVEKYVEEAVRSVMNQTLRNVEIICVDDCSTDGTAVVLERLAVEDKRIRIVRHESNQGLFAVRVHGTQAAHGEYITFLDGDDYLAPEACKEAYELAKNKHVDIVQFGPRLFETEHTSAEQILSLNTIMKPCEERLSSDVGALVSACYVDRKFSWNLCTKLIRAEVLRNAFQFFNGERIVMAEDMLGAFMVMVFAKGYAGLNKPYYNYRQGTGVTAISKYIPVERVRVFAEEYQVYDLLNKWLEKLNVKQKHAKALQFVKRTVYQDMANAFINRINYSDYPKAAEMLKAYWPVEEMAVALSTHLYQENNWKKKASMISAIKRSGMMQTKQQAVRTIGTFYFRMYNGGIERVISKLAPIWQSNGWRVVVFTEEINELDYELPENVIRVVIPRIVENKFSCIEKRTKAWIDAIQKYEIDAMVYHGWLLKELMGDQIAIKSTGIPMVMHTHGLFSIGLGEPGMSYQYQAATQKDGYALCDVIVNLGEVDQAWWCALGYRSVLTVNPSTYDIDQIKPASLKGNNVLWVGRISEQKQIYEAFRIMRLVHRQVPDAKLQIVGSAEAEETMKQVRDYLIAHEMNGYVSLEGYQADVKPYYENAALILWTAGFEGAPMGMVEAKAYGLPIVCYELANVDMTRKAKGMRVVRQKDSADAAKHVVALLQDESLRIQMGKESRESVEEMYDIDLGEYWKRILELAMQPKEEEKMASELSPMETTAQMAMEFLAKGMDYRMSFGVASVSDDEDMMRERQEKMKQLEELYIDGYFVKLYMTINKLFPKGGKGRERLKKVASYFFK